MSTTALKWITVATILAVQFLAPIASAAPLFSDDFESGSLSQWTGKNGGGHNGVIVSDPLRPGNKVLSFSALENAGDVFGTEIFLPVGQAVTVSFEYLGLALPQSVADNFGGFLGISDGLNGGADGLDSQWLAGTKADYGGGGFYSLEEHLIDDGQWRTYVVTIANPFASFHVMAEDWISAGGVSGDVFIDNITVVPEPSGILLAVFAGFGLALLKLTGLRTH